MPIPYASSIVNEKLQLVKICPVCKEQFPEHTDSYGERTTQNYASHYATAHGTTEA